MTHDQFVVRRSLATTSRKNDAESVVFSPPPSAGNERLNAPFVCARYLFLRVAPTLRAFDCLLRLDRDKKARGKLCALLSKAV